MAWGTKGSGPGQLSYPRGLAANEHEVVVADDDNHRVEVFTTEGAYVAEAGSQGTGPGQFGFPYGVALDAAGDVYVADDLNHRVVKLTPQLTFAGAWGGFGTQTRPVRVPARDRQRPRGRNLRRRHGQPPRSGVRPARQLPAHDRASPRAGRAS